MSKTKQIDFSKDVIPANGKNYTILKELPIARFEELDKMEVELYYGFDMKGLYDKLVETFNDLNKSRPADASVKIHNLLKGVADKVDQRTHIILRICSLFLVTEDEDVNEWSEDLAKQKTEDWAKEGYSMNSFFTLVVTFKPGFLEAYNEISQNTLAQNPTEKSSRKSKASSKL